MIGLFRRHSPFRRALEAAGLERCSISGADLWVGLPPDANYKRQRLAAVPDAPRSVLFVEGPEQARLIAAFAAGPEAMTIENLMIGTSHDYVAGHQTPYDFSAAMAALMKARMPALKRLMLGDMELLFNGHGYYGYLGDVTDVFEVAPNLVDLRICGRAEISRPTRHQQLQILSLIADDIAGNSGPTDRDTVANILSSHFPKLVQLDLALEADDAPAYDIPEAFYAGLNMPVLRDVEIDSLMPEHQARLERWKADRRSKMQGV